MEASHRSKVAERPKVVRRAGFWITAIFWTVQFAELTIANWSADPADAAAYLGPRTVVVAVGFLLTLLVVEIAGNRFFEGSFRRRVVFSILAAAAASIAVAMANYAIYLGFMPVPGIRFDAVQFMYQIFAWSWFFFSIAAAMLAFYYSLEARDREQKLAEAHAMAQSARLQALRYQLNPHFLFNTLNSLAALISRRDNDLAENMVENLSDFLRSSLDFDPLEDIPLLEEIELQTLYLDVERLRFPERLDITIDIPKEVEGALVPCLITQPLIENVIKHAVSQTAENVALSVTARAEGEKLCIKVRNSLGSGTARSSTRPGLGIANVKARLSTCFGDKHELETDHRPDRFEVTMRMPLRFPE